jgi:histidyl-tRNA synthetase
MKPQPAKGTRDFLPAQMRTRDRVIGAVKRVFESFGYAPLETPALERLEVLSGKYGEDADRLVFKILKRGDAGERGEADLGLRYDLTVPLARVIAANQDIPKPFKRYQVQPVWRAEKPQRGRFREFFQCDADCVGTSSVLADAEIIAIVHEVLTALGFAEHRISINHRLVLAAFMATAGVRADVTDAAIRAIDKLDKIGKEGVEEELIKTGAGDDTARTIVDTLIDLNRAADFGAYAASAGKAVGTSPPGLAALAEMEQLALYVSYMGVPDTALSFDLHMARGLDYYTGPIFEAFVAGAGGGSVAGGGRYDHLIAKLGGPDLPATGVSFGLERIIDLLEEREPAGARGGYGDVMVAAFDESALAEAIKAAGEVRAAGFRCDLYAEPRAKLGKQFSYADAINVRAVVVVGPDELARGVVQIKSLATREQTEVPREGMAAALAALLK